MLQESPSAIRLSTEQSCSVDVVINPSPLALVTFWPLALQPLATRTGEALAPHFHRVPCPAAASQREKYIREMIAIKRRKKLKKRRFGAEPGSQELSTARA